MVEQVWKISGIIPAYVNNHFMADRAYRDAYISELHGCFDNSFAKSFASPHFTVNQGTSVTITGINSSEQLARRNQEALEKFIDNHKIAYFEKMYKMLQECVEYGFVLSNGEYTVMDPLSEMISAYLSVQLPEYPAAYSEFDFEEYEIDSRGVWSYNSSNEKFIIPWSTILMRVARGE